VEVQKAIFLKNGPKLSHWGEILFEVVMFRQLVGTRDLQPAEKGGKKKKNSGSNPGQPAGKGRGKKTLVLTLGSPPKKGGKKTLGNPPDLDFRTWVSGPQSQNLSFRTQTDARNASYCRLIFFPSFFSASTVTFLFPVT
jgi:hypothetical protein